MSFSDDYFILNGLLEFVSTFKRGDTLDWLKNKTQWFDSFYRNIFVILFVIINIVFLIHTTNYLFGNHDFDYVMHGVGLSLWNGRYTNALPLKICGGYLSPVLNNLLSILAMITSAMLICAYWGLPKRKRYWLSACLLPMLLPYVVTWFYYSYETFSHTLLPGIAVGALWLVRDKMNLERLVISVGLIWFTLGIYPSILSIFVLIICAQLIIDILNKDLKEIFHRNVRFFIVLLGGGVLFKITLLVLKVTGKLSPSLYNLSVPTAPELVKKLIPELILGIKQFFHNTPYISIPLKMLIFLTVVVAIFLTLVHIDRTKFVSKLQNFGRFIFLLFLWCGMFFACMIPDYLSQDDFAFVVRTAYFGLPFLALICFTLICRLGNKQIINFSIIVIIIILWCSAVSDFEIQKNWKIGFENEILAYSRVLSMIEQNPDVSKLEPAINYLQVGSLPSKRKAFCRPPVTDGIASLELHSFEFNPDWSPRAGVVFDYLGNSLKWKYRGSFRVDLETISQKIDLTSTGFMNFLKQAKAYPAPSEQCLYVDIKNNSLVVVLNEKALEELKVNLGIN
ncbi:MAG: glucosyltransferase domain-containing protein [Victivallales bacterium]|nr:glucosyltransferase domain-containing protein [Victivallales bacterium]